MNRDVPGRVMVLTHVLGGGTGIQIRGIYGGAVLSGWEREVVVLGPGTEPAPEGASLTRLPALAEFGPYPLGQARAFLALRRHVREWRPDVLHTYFFWPVLFGRLLKAAGDVDHVLENREDEGFNWGRHEYAWLRLTRFLPDNVVCVSESVRQCVEDREGLTSERVEVIHNGVPEPVEVSAERVAAVRRELGIGADRPVIGMVANMNRPVKGVRYFLDAARKVLSEEPRTVFLLVGGGEEENRHRRRVEELGITESVIFAGFREDVAPFYELMDVSVLSSLSEGLSITLLESMSRGLPVVVTRVGGNPEVVIDGRTGHLVPPRDPSAMATRIVELIRDAELRERMGERARRRIESEFTLGATAAEYGRLLETLVT